MESSLQYNIYRRPHAFASPRPPCPVKPVPCRKQSASSASSYYLRLSSMRSSPPESSHLPFRRLDGRRLTYPWTSRSHAPTIGGEIALICDTMLTHPSRLTVYIHGRYPHRMNGEGRGEHPSCRPAQRVLTHFPRSPVLRCLCLAYGAENTPNRAVVQRGAPCFGRHEPAAKDQQSRG